MNLRTVKKDVSFFVSDFIDDCCLMALCHPELTDDVNKLIDEAVALHNALRDKINAPEGNKRAWYAAVVKEMFEKLDGLCEKLSEAVTSKLGK